MKLYDIASKYEVLFGELESAESEEERASIEADIEALDHDMGAKAEAYARVMRNRQADVEALKKEIERLQAKKKAAESTVEWLKANIMTAMKLADTKKINTTIGNWRIQQNDYSVEIGENAVIPAEFCTPQPDKIDKRGIIAHFKQTGEEFAGCTYTRGESVRFS